MSVPEAVLKQAAEAEKALDDFVAQNEEQPSGEADAEQPTDIAADKLGQPAGKAEASPETQALQRKLELEQQRTASLKGRIDSQLAQANGENKELKAKLASMEEKLDKLSKANAVPGPRRYITEEEASDLGDEVLGVQERIIKGTLEEELDSGTIKDMVDGLVKQSLAAQQVQAPPVSISTELFWNTVERYYPNAEAMNDGEQGWHDFLELHDPISGLKNRDLGQQAIGNGDVATLVDLLQAYKPLQGHVAGERKPSLKPERTGAEPVVMEPVKPEWKKSEVERFYDDVARNKFRGTKEEAVVIENEIMEAAQDGRIIEG